MTKEAGTFLDEIAKELGTIHGERHPDFAAVSENQEKRVDVWSILEHLEEKNAPASFAW